MGCDEAVVREHVAPGTVQTLCSTGVPAKFTPPPYRILGVLGIGVCSQVEPP